MKVFVYNNNTCTRVKLYGLDVIELFTINNNIIVDNKNDADMIIINTCSFLKSKEIYFLNFIRKINNQKLPHQKIMIIGCLPSVNKEEIININSDILMFGRDIEKIKEYFKFKRLPKTKASTVEDTLPFKKKIIYLFNKLFLHSKHIEYRLKKNKVCYLQISTGCLGTCTYCSEKFTTNLKSRPIKEIIETIYDGISRGFRLFGLNSDDASAYGKDINTSLEELLTEIVKIKEDIYFSIPEFNPNGLTDKVIELLKDKKFLYITVPIQSGSQRILNLMQRPYNIKKVKDKITKLRKANKKLMINTHVIVGFPSESESDFKMTNDLLNTGLFDRVKVFCYNERPNTKALFIEPKISEEVKEQRKEILLKTMKKQNLKKLSFTNIILNKEQLK